jgi:D-alanine-D-alanine ligase
MKLAVLYTPATPASGPETRDGEVQRETIASACAAIGHTVVPIAFGFDLEAVRDALMAARPDCVFNLVESVWGRDRYIYLAPALLESVRLPYTGVRLTGMLQTTNKPIAKRLMRAVGIDTPDWCEPGNEASWEPVADRRVIVKSAWDHASAGISVDSIVSAAEPAEVAGAFAHLDGRFDTPFAEEFVEGREVNVALLEVERSVEALPPAEIRFDGYGDRPPVVCYRAKWETGSFEYANTPRTFEFSDRDTGLLDKIQSIARRCWESFGLRGYARVDFRVDEFGVPWVLEVNANPCLSPDAGFMAAAHRCGYAITDVAHWLLHAAMRDPGCETTPCMKLGAQSTA